MDDVVTRSGLLAAGWTARSITAAVRAGRLMRIRNGRYASPGLDSATVEAVGVGGRLGCVSELRRLGIWVHQPARIHVHFPPTAVGLGPESEHVAHWSRLVAAERATAGRVHVLDALSCALLCLPRLEAIAALDSALNLAFVTFEELSEAVGQTARGRRLLAATDRRAESGLETFVRVSLRDAGLRVRSQVRFAGIGIVDLLVEEQVVVELDGSEFHDGSAASTRDRQRDARHAAAGRTPLRFRYAQVVYGLPAVVAATVGAVAVHRRVRNSGEVVRRARRRTSAVTIS